jgi:hypothetical protein
MAAGLVVGVVYGDEAADELARKLANPVGSVYSLPFEFTADNGAANGDAYILNVQPVIPVTLNENWNLINRTIIPFIDAPGAPVGGIGNPEPVYGDRVFGLGDISHTMFLSPAAPGTLIWGVGPMIGFPTATDDTLGSEKWKIGPSVVLLAQPKPWTVGVLFGNLWSFAGNDDRADINQFFFQYFINYSLSGGWYLTTTPMMTANWNADRNEQWIIPIGGGAGKLFKVGSLPIRAQLQGFYNVEKPTGAPDGSVMLTVQFVFPR